MAGLKQNKLIKLIFFGNHFYGICAVALSIEGSLQQSYPVPSLLYFIMAYSSTVLFYSKAYIMTEVSDDIANLRSMWYARNRSLMQTTQIFFLIVLALSGGYFLIREWTNVMHLKMAEWLMICIFPIVSGMYYGVDSQLIGNINLRNIGWLKPFIIGFTWAGLANIYPPLFYCITEGTHFELTVVGFFLFVKNFMFITILCIMFDIKDYAMDYNAQLKTVVVKLGLRRTIFYFIIPLCIIGLASFWIYAFSRDFSTMKILINTLPFILIITVAYTMHSRKSIFYYLVIIDGLMLFKALCGSIAMVYF